MRAVVEGRLDAADPAFQTHIDRCLGCRGCESVCPSGVEYGQLLELARVEAVAAGRQPWLTRILLRIFASKALSRSVMAPARWIRASGLPALLVSRSWGDGVGATARFGLAMVEASRPVAFPATSTSPTAGESGGPGGTSRPSAGDERLRVGVLMGCVQDQLFRRVNEATVRVLEANGMDVVPVASQECCGALHAHSGDLAGARSLAIRNIQAFQDLELDRVAVNAAGCGAAMKEYGHLLEDDPSWAARAVAFSRKVRDISEVLTERPLRAGASMAMTVTVDHPCHLLHAQRLSEPPLEVLKAIPGLEIIPLRNADECCGGAGIYGVTHPDLGARIGGDKVGAVLETAADGIATGNPGCMMQIGAGLRMAGSDMGVWHPVELLDESYRRAGYYSS
jgi:glycolate oxidase iron-sulfur subunit